MRSLHARILVFYFGTLLLSLIAFVAIDATAGGQASRERFSKLFELQIDGAVRAYEDGGAAELAPFLQRLDRSFTATHYLLDDQNRDLVSGQIVTPQLSTGGNNIASTVARRLFALRRTFIVSSADGKYRLLYVNASGWENLPAQLPYYLLVLVVTALIYSFVAVGIASALKTISRTADRFGQGDFSARVPESNRRDEIGSLARSFNSMASRIQTLLVAERRLLQDVSHELRSPLARLAFAVELARTAPDRQAAINRLKREVDCLAGLVASLVEITRAEGDPLAHKFEPLRVDEVLHDVIESCTLEAEASGCRIAPASSSTAEIRGDRELLRRAFDNVLRNAVRYSPGGAAIEVACKDEGGRVIVEVRDYGAGVPDHLLGRIFEPFFRVDESRRTSTGGVGLGLSIVRRILELHQGSAEAHNANPGLRVTMAFPVATDTTEVPVSGERQPASAWRPAWPWLRRA
jgi:two-component system sensor histidine kinase CpxA